MKDLSILINHRKRFQKFRALRFNLKLRYCHALLVEKYSPCFSLQVYEVTMFCTKHSDHNVVNAALECLNQILQTRPHCLITVLLSPRGISPTVTNASATIAGMLLFCMEPLYDDGCFYRFVTCFMYRTYSCLIIALSVKLGVAT